MTKRSKIKKGKTICTEICSNGRLSERVRLIEEFSKSLEDGYLNISKIKFMPSKFTFYGVNLFKGCMSFVEKYNIRTIFLFSKGHAMDVMDAQAIQYCIDKGWKVDFY